MSFTDAIADTFKNTYQPVHKPFDHQLMVISDTWYKDYWAFFLEMGTGKSKIAIDTFFLQYVNGLIDGVVIIAQKGEYANWYFDQLPEHGWKNVPHSIFLYRGGKATGKGYKAAFDEFLGKKDKLRIFIINIESVGSTNGKKFMEKFYKAIRPDDKTKKRRISFNLDESTCVKHHESKRAKTTLVFARNSLYRRIMTGTPVTERPIDIWGQALMLGSTVLGHSSYYSFRGEYAILEDVFMGQRVIKNVVTGYKNTEKLRIKIKEFSHLIKKEECLDLPDKVYRKHAVELTKDQEKLYQQLRDEAMAEIGDEIVEATSALSLITKLHQVACGHIKTGEGEAVAIENNRVSSLMEILEDYPGKVIIWANYRRSIEDVTNAIERKFGKGSVGAYYGATGVDERGRIVSEFKDPYSPLRFFVANAQSAGYGLTLTSASLVIYYANGYSLTQRLQSEDRAHRIGQTEKVTYIDMYCPGTVDERIMKTLRNKKNMSDSLLGTPLSQWI